MQKTQSTAELRTAARAEVRRVLLARKYQLSEMLRDRLSPRDVALVAEHARSIHGVLGALWCQFIRLGSEEQIALLSNESFNGMEWQSLMQSNPYAMLAQWKKIALRPYE